MSRVLAIFDVDGTLVPRPGMEMRFARFLLACLGFFPHLLMEVYFGYAGKHVAHMASGSSQGGHLHDVVVIGGLVVSLIVMIIVSGVAHRALSEAVSGATEVIDSG